jgi:hypothetical protein
MVRLSGGTAKGAAGGEQGDHTKGRLTSSTAAHLTCGPRFFLLMYKILGCLVPQLLGPSESFMSSSSNLLHSRILPNSAILTTDLDKSREKSVSRKR